MNEQKMIVDLGAGLGGATEAFIDDPNWIVMRFDIAPQVAHIDHMYWGDYVHSTTYVIDRIQEKMHSHEILPKNLYIWASPECKEWSDGYNSKKSMQRRIGIEFEPDLSQLTAIRHIVEVLKPKAWIVENVQGGMEFINPVLGPPATMRKPFFFWGEFPLFRIPKIETNKTDLGPSEMRYWERSKIPILISESMKKAFDNQTTLTEFIQ
tara:strand:- start:156 stop:782 length:627 start_codon:yes stop_codon:yes gene_type:complete